MFRIFCFINVVLLEHFPLQIFEKFYNLGDKSCETDFINRMRLNIVLDFTINFSVLVQ